MSAISERDNIFDRMDVGQEEMTETVTTLLPEYLDVLSQLQQIPQNGESVTGLTRGVDGMAGRRQVYNGVFLLANGQRVRVERADYYVEPGDPKTLSSQAITVFFDPGNDGGILTFEKFEQTGRGSMGYIGGRRGGFYLPQGKDISGGPYLPLMVETIAKQTLLNLRQTLAKQNAPRTA